VGDPAFFFCIADYSAVILKSFLCNRLRGSEYSAVISKSYKGNKLWQITPFSQGGRCVRALVRLRRAVNRAPGSNDAVIEQVRHCRSLDCLPRIDARQNAIEIRTICAGS
jgi:hypothetical protein